MHKAIIQSTDPFEVTAVDVIQPSDPFEVTAVDVLLIIRLSCVAYAIIRPHSSRLYLWDQQKTIVHA
jgi:hypothetical protein